MKTRLATWQFWALDAAGFAALTAICAKIGVEGGGSDFATLIRTVVILVVVSLLVFATGEWQPLASASQKTRVFLTLSGTRQSSRGRATFARRRWRMRRGWHRSTSCAW